MKKLCAIIMSAVLIILLAVPSFASEKRVDKTAVDPVIVIAGVGCSPYYIDAGTENERTCMPPTVDAGKIIVKAVLGIVKAIFTHNFQLFADTAADIALDILDDFSCDSDGNSKGNVTTLTFPKAQSNYDYYLTSTAPELQIVHSIADEIGAERTYFYNYDWRLDPVCNAKQLDEYISNVLSEQRCCKVDLIPCSMGGAQTLAYLSEYGSESIDSVIFMSSADSGLLFVGNLFSGELQINQYDAFQYIRTLKTGDASFDSITAGLCDLLGGNRLVSVLFRAVNSLGAKLNETAIEKVLKVTFARMPGFWAFVAPDRYESAKELLLSDASKTLTDKIDFYQKNIRQRRDEILKSAKAGGTKIVFCSHYDMGSVPVSSTGSAQGDCLIETVCTSGGAFCAKAGTVLPTDYTQKNFCSGHNHLSADRIIDASTCTFPDSTWFFKGINHVGGYYGSEQCKFLVWILSCDIQPTVFDNPSYPQFMKSDYTTMLPLSPVTQ